MFSEMSNRSIVAFAVSMKRNGVVPPVDFVTELFGRGIDVDVLEEAYDFAREVDEFDAGYVMAMEILSSFTEDDEIDGEFKIGGTD